MSFRENFDPGVYGITPTKQLCMRKPVKYEYKMTMNEQMVLDDLDSCGQPGTFVMSTGLYYFLQQQNHRDDPETNVYFFHPDHLGSTSYITAFDGTPYQHVDYLPFGEVLLEEKASTWLSPYKFNCKELDDESGLYYYGARYYDPRTSVFLGVDPLAEKYPSLSPFVYCADNPVIYIDPDGMKFDPASKKVAMKAKADALKLANKMARRAARTRNDDLKQDYQAREKQLRTSAEQIQKMEDDKEYLFSINETEDGDPLTLPTSNLKTIQMTCQVDNEGSLFQELRHGFQAMNGEIDFIPDGKGGWVSGPKYGVNDEISGWNAEYAFSGGLSVPLIGGIPYKDAYGVADPKLTKIERMNQINASLINAIARKVYGIDRTRPLYPINAPGWNEN